jgi:hypothetical protein
MVAVAAVRVSIGGGLIGTAISEEVVDDVVVVLLEDEVEALRDIPGVDCGSRGNVG